MPRNHYWTPMSITRRSFIRFNHFDNVWPRSTRSSLCFQLEHSKIECDLGLWVYEAIRMVSRWWERELAVVRRYPRWWASAYIGRESICFRSSLASAQAVFEIHAWYFHQCTHQVVTPIERVFREKVAWDEHRRWLISRFLESVHEIELIIAKLIHQATTKAVTIEQIVDTLEIFVSFRQRSVRTLLASSKTLLSSF